MRVYTFRKPSSVQSCYAYLLLGEWDNPEDINTIIDVGIDGYFIKNVDQITSSGKKNRLDQIILTHSHLDHSGGVREFKKRYGSKVLAFAPGEDVDEVLKDGQSIRVADQTMTVIHSPGHSDDSICLYSPVERAIFCGDVPLIIPAPGTRFPIEFIHVLSAISDLDIATIYPGHSEPVTEDASGLIKKSLKNLLS